MRIFCFYTKQNYSKNTQKNCISVGLDKIKKKLYTMKRVLEKLI